MSDFGGEWLIHPEARLIAAIVRALSAPVIAAGALGGILGRMSAFRLAMPADPIVALGDWIAVIKPYLPMSLLVGIGSGGMVALLMQAFGTRLGWRPFVVGLLRSGSALVAGGIASMAANLIVIAGTLPLESSSDLYNVAFDLVQWAAVLVLAGCVAFWWISEKQPRRGKFQPDMVLSQATAANALQPSGEARSEGDGWMENEQKQKALAAEWDAKVQGPAYWSEQIPGAPPRQQAQARGLLPSAIVAGAIGGTAAAMVTIWMVIPRSTILEGWAFFALTCLPMPLIFGGAFGATAGLIGQAVGDRLTWNPIDGTVLRLASAFIGGAFMSALVTLCMMATSMI